MNITLDQLKEIAKAGYGDSNFILSRISFTHCDEVDGALSLIYDYETLLTVYIDNNFSSNLYVNLNAEDNYFNHLAAIRKMEELGIIEK